MNIRGGILLCFVVVVPYTTIIQDKLSGMPLNIEPEAMPQAVAIAQPQAMPLSIAPIEMPQAFQDALPPQTGTPTLVAQAQAPIAIPEPATTIPAQPTQGLDAILAPTENFPTEQLIPVPLMGQQEVVNQEEAKDIYLNFDNTELSNFINYMAEIKKLNLITDKGIEGNKISLTIREPLSVEGAWNVFLTVIEMAGFSIVQVGDVYKVVSKDKKAMQPLPAYINIPVDKIPDNDSNIRYVMLLTNLQVANMKDLIQSMLSDKGTVVEVKDVNGMIITDKCFNIKTAVRVLQELDQMGTAETVTVMHLKTANAIDVKTLLDTIIKQPEVSPLARLLGKTAEGGAQFFPPGTRIIAEERTNSLILLGNPKPIKKIEEFIINHLDTELQDAKSPLHVFELQYTDASQIADILNEVTQAGDSATGQAAAKYGAIRGGVKYFKKMNFKVDKDGNRLIVSSSDKVDWKLLKQTIKDLDKPQPQVAIETLIVTVTIDDNKNIGGAVRLKKSNTLGQNIGFQSAPLGNSPILDYPKNADGTLNTNLPPSSLLGNMITQIASAQGLTALTFGGKNNIWGVFNMLKTQTNASILSQPFITAINKTKATVTVGSTERVVQEDGGTSGLKGYAQATAATKLEITPQINIDGVIGMHIHTEINEFGATANQTSEKTLDTNVTVADGQVLVLGGFVKTSVSESKWKTPLLGDLPILGWLFKSQQRAIKKEYLFIFLCPTIVKPRQLPGMGLYTKMKLHDVTDSIESSIQTKKTPDPIHNWFFNSEKENYSHKVIDFANARYQPTTVDIKNDPYYRTQTYRQQKEDELKETGAKTVAPPVLSEDLPKPLSPQIAENLQMGQMRDGMKNLLSAQVPSTPEPLIEASNIDQEKRTQIKELITQIPEPTAIPSNDQILSNQEILPEVDDKQATFKNFISTKAEALQQHQVEPPVRSQGQALTVDVNKRNRLKEFLSNNPAMVNNASHFDRRGMA